MFSKFGIVAIIIVLIGTVFGGIFGRLPKISGANDSVTIEKVSSDYQQALEIIENNYATKINYEKVSESSIQGMLWTLDPHSAFFTSNEFRKLFEDQSSRFYGIGVSILQHRGGVYVQAIVPGTPADKAGLKYGDRFLEIEGKNAENWTSAQVSQNVRGAEGTPVNIKIERPGAEKPLDFRIVRGGVPSPSVRNYFMLGGDTGYVGLTGGFQSTTSDEVKEAIEELKRQGMKQMILDLRGNGGGLLNEAIEVVSMFVPRGKTVVSVKGRSRYSNNEELKTVSGEVYEFPLVVLINGNSASASEIVAGALQDYGRALIVGSDSFGKGLVQKIFSLPGRTGLTLTMARYYTPYGRSLQRDYSSGSLYDYYAHGGSAGDNANAAAAPPKPAGSPVTTEGGRVFYGGQGITPDLKAPALAGSTLRFRINEAAFFFARQLVSGRIAGMESYRMEKQNGSHRLQASDLPITDKLLESFKAFIEKDKDLGLTGENVNSQLDYAKSRLREELASANYSTEAGTQVLLETDPQVLKAVDALPEAKKLFESVNEKE